MKCPHCGERIPEPTYKQIEAYLLVHIHGFTQEQAGVILGVSQRAVGYRLQSLKKFRGKIFPSQEEYIRLRKNITTYNPNTSKIQHQF